MSQSVPAVIINVSPQLLVDTLTHPQTTNLIPQHRPGRSLFRKTTDIDIECSYGSSFLHRNPDTIRIFFQNTKGLTYSATGEDYDYYLTCTQSIGADLIGMSETNTAWQHPHLRNLFTSRARRHFSSIKASFSSPSPAIDPVPEKETFQSGGTVTLSTGALVPMIYGDTITDPTGLGRWSDQTIRGRNNKLFSTITGYRVCKGSIAESKIGSAFSREYEHHRTRNITSPRSRQLFLNDLRDVIISLQEHGHSILLMLDSNGQLKEDPELTTFVETCGLHDLHHDDPAPSTYIGSTTSRIDHIFGCSATLASLSTSGSLSYLDGPQSDHRGLYVDLDTTTLLSQTIAPPSIATSLSRPLKSGNPESVATYNEHMLKYYADHSMVETIQDLRLNRHMLSRSAIKKKLEKWDRDQGRAVKYAESQLQQSYKPFAWSPEFRNAGIVYRYWRLRLRELQHSADYSTTFTRIEQTVNQHNPEFRLPKKDITLSLDEIRQHLKAATTNLLQKQKDSEILRYKSYLDLLAVYESDTNHCTQKESQRKATIVRNTIKSEQTRAMYRNIRQVLKPEQTGGLTKLQIPRHKDASTYPDDFQKLLSETAADDIIWDTVLDKESIHSNLLKYNRNSFRAASKSPCGHGHIHDQLTFTSLSFEASELLSGTLPPT